MRVTGAVHKCDHGGVHTTAKRSRTVVAPMGVIAIVLAAGSCERTPTDAPVDRSVPDAPGSPRSPAEPSTRSTPPPRQAPIDSVTAVALPPQEAATPRGSLSLSAFNIVGAADSTKLQASITKQAQQLSECYERALQSNAEVSGDVTVILELADGRVASVEFDCGRLDSADLRSCMAEAAVNWRVSEQRSAAVTFEVALRPL